MKRILMLGILTIGMFISALPMLHDWNWILFVCAFLGVWCCFKYKRLIAVGSLIDDHPIASFLIVLTAGICIRILIGFAMHYWDNAEPIYSPWSDSFVFWNHAKDVSQGVWPDSKSWTTTIQYGGLLALFGEKAVVLIFLNFLLQTATSLLIFCVAKKWFGNFVGVWASAFYFLSPTLMFYAFTVLSEHAYFFWMMVCLWLYTKVEATNRFGVMFTGLLALSVCMWLVTWSRGEGIVLWGIFPFVFVIDCLHRKFFRFGLMGSVIFIIVFILGSQVGYSLNIQHDSFFCSSDSWWPRLHGACVETDGRFGGGRVEVFQEAERAFPHKKFEYKLGCCPKELVPIIRAEIVRRWRSMDVVTMIKFVLRKEIFNFGGEKVSFSARGGALRCVTFLINEISVIMVCTLSLLFFYQWFRCREYVLALSTFIPLLIVCGVATVLLVTESQPRYGFVIEVMFPFYAASAFKFVTQRCCINSFCGSTFCSKPSIDIGDVSKILNLPITCLPSYANGCSRA